MTFDPTFRLYRDDPQRRALETLADMGAEARAELLDRRRLYPNLVRTGRLTAAASEHEGRTMAAIAWDLSLLYRDGLRPAAATWEAIVHTCRREIALRRQLYPQRVAAGRLDQAEADRKLTMMESIHDYYWSHSHQPAAIAARDAAEREPDRRAAA